MVHFTHAFVGTMILLINRCLDQKLAKCYQNRISMGVFQKQISNVRVKACKIDIFKVLKRLTSLAIGIVGIDQVHTGGNDFGI